MKRMTPAEFRNLGYLQEVNRRFLHPLGLALEVVADEDGTARFGEVWDCRDDPEGIIFDTEAVDLERYADLITEEKVRRITPRVDALGFWEQPA